MNTNTSNTNQEVEIDLLELWHVFVQHLLPIILAAVLAVGAVFAYGYFLQEPTYKSTATLYILKSDGETASSSTDFSLALNVINDCKYMVTSHEVLDKVIDNTKCSQNYNQLKSAISINNPSSTRVLEVTVETESATMSKKIVDEICKIAANKINDTMGVSQVNIYSQGTIANAPANTFGMKIYALAGVGAAFVVYAIYACAYLFDDKIKTVDDVNKYLGLSVLGEIPNANDTKHNKNKYYGYGNTAPKKKKGGKK